MYYERDDNNINYRFDPATRCLARSRGGGRWWIERATCLVSAYRLPSLRSAGIARTLSCPCNVQKVHLRRRRRHSRILRNHLDVYTILLLLFITIIELHKNMPVPCISVIGIMIFMSTLCRARYYDIIIHVYSVISLYLATLVIIRITIIACNVYLRPRCYYLHYYHS